MTIDMETKKCKKCKGELGMISYYFEDRKGEYCSLECTGIKEKGINTLKTSI